MEIKEIVAKAGGTRALGRALGVTGQAISQWREVPADRVLDVERITGIPCWELRPDLYPPERFAKEAA